MLKTLVAPRGRTGRLRFWNTLAKLGIAYEVIGIALILGAAFLSLDMRVSLIAVCGLTLVFLYLGAIVGIRRLHDRDLSGWWILLALVPGLGSLWYLWNGMPRGSETANRFGPSTTAHDIAVVAVFDANTAGPSAGRQGARVALGTILLWGAFAITTTMIVLLFQNPSH